MNEPATYRPALERKSNAIRYALMALVIEKILQHTIVSVAFYSNWGDIRSTVAVDPGLLMVLGALVALLFALSLWGVVVRRAWATNLLVALSLFDIMGEFLAQGRAALTITVSFLVAIALLLLTLAYRRQ